MPLSFEGGCYLRLDYTANFLRLYNTNIATSVGIEGTVRIQQ